MMALTYFPHLQLADDRPNPRGQIRQKTPRRPQNSPATDFPNSEDLRKFIGCKAGEVIAQMRTWGYKQVTLNVPENRMSVATEGGRLHFQFLPQDAIVNRIDWESLSECQPSRKNS
jgi:hypothetical protein